MHIIESINDKYKNFGSPPYFDNVGQVMYLIIYNMIY